MIRRCFKPLHLSGHCDCCRVHTIANIRVNLEICKQKKKNKSIHHDFMYSISCHLFDKKQRIRHVMNDHGHI